MNKGEKNKRRAFIRTLGLGTLGALAAPYAFSLPAKPVKRDGAPKIILFQGDSITDGGRSYNKDWNHIMGQSFPYLISSRLWFDHIDQQLMFYNRGISGNTVKNLLDRWQPDALDLKPDILSILVGVNDVFAVIKNNNPTTVEEFKLNYEQLIIKTTTALPDVKLVICEPFILPVGQVKENPDRWQQEITPRQAIVKALAKQYNAVFVPLQHVFTDATQKAPADYWIWDGVHPMPAGHELIARQWIKVVKKELGFPR
ncbi:SGNH/GDSL hydrolase family protein [Mucilaginibacter sp. SP1R1]|uniref:SGNH/GDSL hydrolase family protein n=1 Tax=Mucilaginibacter sp. SP1R1 TaxID=2723091 RepID=UPI001611F944|nr:SGNH/GDSL hydrolase family protein [Mucilaginibacter sp. SP1R1]MBB6148201.1 lysophospholipase L1-like esterase [Mucilaginibacter sp. SP1R1]